jgi:hypothetical protein
VDRDGNILRYRADFRTLHALTEYLWKDCCSGGDKAASEPPMACCGAKAGPRAKR